jgi:antitoxin HicB
MNASKSREYPVTLESDENGTVIATVPDVRGVVTYGDDADEAVAQSTEALTVMISGLMDDNEEIPAPSRPKKGQPTIALPPLVESKVLLYETMRRVGVSRAELARRLGGKNPTHITRLLNVLHQSRHDQLDEAMAVLGARLVVSAEPLPPLERERKAG